MKLILMILIPVIILGAGGALLFNARQKSIVSPASLTQEKKEAPIPSKTIEDEWGLKIHYPESLTAAPATKSGELTGYVFTDENHTGSITIISKETSSKTADEYIKSSNDLKDAATLDTTVGGKPGKKIRLTGNSTKVIAIDDGQVFEFTVAPGEGEEEYWNKTFNDLVAAYEFLPFEGEEETTVNSAPNSDDSPQAPADTGDADVSEETIE